LGNSFLACEGGVDEEAEKLLNLRVFLCCFHACIIPYSGWWVKGGGWFYFQSS
jgi:hypothetical protein